MDMTAPQPQDQSIKAPSKEPMGKVYPKSVYDQTCQDSGV